MRKLIIQQCLSLSEKFYSPFNDMMRLTYPRHSAYAQAHGYDYWHIMGSIHLDLKGGGWDKVDLIRQGLERYDFVAWVDCDAAIMDIDAELMDGLPEDKLLGAVWHDPEQSEFLKANQVPGHYNIGITFWRGCDLTRQFAAEWFAAYPGHPRWMEQGTFNELMMRAEYSAHFARLEDKYNATVNVNEVPKPVIKGWHGISPIVQRLRLMQAELGRDLLTFRV